MKSKGSPLKRAGSLFFLKRMKLLEHHIEKTIRRLHSQPLLLILVALFFMGGTVKRARRSLPKWAVQSL